MMRERELVADYPRPPFIERIVGSVVIQINAEIIAESHSYVRGCET